MALTLILSGFPAPVTRRFKALETLLTRGDVRRPAAAGIKSALAQVFRLPATMVAPAPFTHLADTARRDDSYWMRADPVHLAADRDRLVMLPQAALDVSLEEAQTFAVAFNRMYKDDGLFLETPVPSRWYLRMPADFDCVTHDPAEIAGAGVLDYMPAGRDEGKLRQLMNEIQMLFHEHPVNQARDAAARPPINSVWLWGGGRLPDSVTGGPQRVITNLPLARGLALSAGSECLQWPAPLDTILSADESLIALAVHNPANLAAIEQEIAIPLLAALRSGRLEYADIHLDGAGMYRVTRASLYRLWRRNRSLADLLGNT